MPGGENVPVGAHRCLGTADQGLSEGIAFEIIFPGPDHFHRLLDRLGNVGRIHDGTGFLAAAERATREQGMDGHVFRFQLQDLGHVVLLELGPLRAHPTFDRLAVRGNSQRGILRFQRRVIDQFRADLEALN